MCCLFGLIDTSGQLATREKEAILKALAVESEERGTDATGIAYCAENGLTVYKRPVAAHKLHIRLPEGSSVIMGHTRAATQGRASRNRNNHPFYGSVPGKQFALAHNGVLVNDDYLRTSRHLPKTRIETDSYIAVQLIEKKRTLDFGSLRYMAEQVEGSFTFTVLDEGGNLYFVKGDNPLCLYHYDCGVYIYASTEAIVKRALRRLRLDMGVAEPVQMECGEILRLAPNGEQDRAEFDASGVMPPRRIWYPRSYSYTGTGSAEVGYLEELKSVAACYGFAPESIDRLLKSGFTTDEIEEFLYEGMSYG